MADDNVTPLFELGCKIARAQAEDLLPAIPDELSEEDVKTIEAMINAQVEQPRMPNQGPMAIPLPIPLPHELNVVDSQTRVQWRVCEIMVKVVHQMWLMAGVDDVLIYHGSACDWTTFNLCAQMLAQAGWCATVGHKGGEGIDLVVTQDDATLRRFNIFSEKELEDGKRAASAVVPQQAQEEAGTQQGDNLVCDGAEEVNGGDDRAHQRAQHAVGGAEGFTD